MQIGTTGDSQATEAVKEDKQVSRFNKGADAIQALKNGKIDCVVIDSLPAEKFVEANDDLKIVDGIFDKEEYAICLKKGNTELKEEMNQALKELKEDGILEQIQSNYLGDENTPMNLLRTQTILKERLLWLPMQNLSHGNTKKAMKSWGLMRILQERSAIKWDMT